MEPDIIESGSGYPRFRPRLPHPSRRVIAVTAVAAVAVAVAICLTVRLRPEPAGYPIPVAAGQGVQALAVSGNYLYAATDYGGDAPYALAVYDRATGRRIRQLSVPGMPAALRVGPGGGVWLSFSAGVWLLSPDLSRRSASGQMGPPDLLPTGPDTALLGTQNGLTLLTMPAPGAAGRPRARQPPGTLINVQGTVGELASVDGSIVAEVTIGDGLNSYFVIAGEPGVSYGGTAYHEAGFILAEDNGLWVTLNPYGPGPLVRLDARLDPVTPPAVSGDAELAQSMLIWSDGDTIWDATAAGLVCFTYRDGRLGPVGTVRLPGHPAALAAAGGTVYVSLADGAIDVTTSLTSHRIPAACR